MVRLLALLVILAACVTATPGPKVETDFAAALGLTPPRTTLRAATLNDTRPALPTYAHATVRHMAKLANVDGGLPIVCHIEQPVAGQPWTVAWSTRPTPAYPDGQPGLRTFPDLPTALLVSTKPLPEPVDLPHSPGAQFQVPPDHVFTPRAGSFLQQQNGIVTLSATFPPNLVGVRLWLQLLVDGISAPVLEITVGEV